MIDLDELEKIAKAADAVAPGAWERDEEKQDDAPRRHREFFAIDGEGRRMFGTENSDAGFGEIHEEYDDDYSYAWNEPSRRVIDHAVAFSPRAALALIEEVRRLRGPLHEAKEALLFYERGFLPKRNPNTGWLEYRPTHDLLDDCGERARSVATKIEEVLR